MNRRILFIPILVFLGLGRADGGQERPVGNDGAEPGGELRSIPLVDGTVLNGRIRSFTRDDAVIVFHEHGVRRVDLVSVTEPTRGELRREHAEQLAEATREAAEVVDEAAEILAEELGEEFADKLRERWVSDESTWLAWGGLALVGVSVILMFVASFAESPVWGIAFFLTSGLSWLPFCFLCFKRAWLPTMLSLMGTGSLILYAVNLSLE